MDIRSRCKMCCALRDCCCAAAVTTSAADAAAAVAVPPAPAAMRTYKSYFKHTCETITHNELANDPADVPATATACCSLGDYEEEEQQQ